ncbi:hypothetical protein D3C73_1173580 [compost metagenome]
MRILSLTDSITMLPTRSIFTIRPSCTRTSSPLRTDLLLSSNCLANVLSAGRYAPGCKIPLRISVRSLLTIYSNRSRKDCRPDLLFMHYSPCITQIYIMTLLFCFNFERLSNAYLPKCSKKSLYRPPRDSTAVLVLALPGERPP